MKINNKSLYKTVLATGFVWLVSACQLTNLDINVDPNKPATGTLSLLLPNAENAAVDVYTTLVGTGSGFAGQRTSSDDYDLSNTSFQGTWNGLYQEMQSIEEMIKGTEDGNSPVYRGIAQTLKAYSVGNMVDMFGDIPYTEAWKGNATTPNLSPKFDKDSDIYETLIKLCDEAIANLAKPQSVAVKGDYFFAGSAASWTRLAKTVKLRLLFNSRKGRTTGNADLKAAFDAGGYITTAAQNFTYQYSTQISPVDNRHPWFVGPYQGTGDPTYLNHQFMGEMILNKDPRLPLYFFRQTSYVLNLTDPTDRGLAPYGGTYLAQRTSFLTEYKRVFYNNTQEPTKDDIAYLAGYFGRDRSDYSGAPADGSYRTAPGAYPAGGQYSGRETTAQLASKVGGNGNGIWPLITSWNTKFYQVEAILDGTGVTGDAKALFESAMREQIALVVSTAQKADSKTVAPTAATIDAYVAAWIDLYTKAATDQAKLNVVAKQIWFCTYGQGLEIWNMMRRTGYPVQSTFKQFSVGIQTPILKPKRQFALRLPYPQQEANLNPNAATYVTGQIFDRDPIFWDKVKLKWEF